MASRRLVRSLADSEGPPGAPLQEANGLLYLVTQIRTTVKSTVVGDLGTFGNGFPQSF
jgi:hypothetical protein